MAERGVTGADMARALGISEASVSLKLRGQRPLAVGEAQEIAKFLGSTLDDLFGPIREKDENVTAAEAGAS